MEIEYKKETNYIRRRKIKAFRESLLYYIFRIFPIKKNRITVTTYEGKGGFCCNPKYIVKELHKRDTELEFIWLVNDPESKEFPDYIRKEKNDIWHRAYYLTTSKVWIDNYRKPLGTKKRRGQFYVNTWHGNLGFKRIGLWRGKAFSKIAYLVSKNDSDMIDVYLSSSDWTTRAHVRGMLYNGKIIKTGQAREDILHTEERGIISDKIKNEYNVPKDTNVLLYVPTYRETGQKTNRGVYKEESTIDLTGIKQALEARTGCKWVIFVKYHPQLSPITIKLNIDKSIVNVTDHEDVYELLAASDAMVTDYSSLAFEAASAQIPVFLYMDDLDEYVHDRGGLNFDVSPDHHFSVSQEITPGMHAELPFMVATDNDEIIDNIRKFNKEEYGNKCVQIMHDLGMVADGKASERAARIIEGILNSKITI